MTISPIHKVQYYSNYIIMKIGRANKLTSFIELCRMTSNGIVTLRFGQENEMDCC